MTRSQADNWSIMRSLAFLAATFAITFASLMPFAALAAAVPGQPIVFCSAEGVHTIAVGMDGEHGGSKGLAGVKCAACLLVAPAALPDAPVVAPLSAGITRPAQVFVAINDRPRPPARAPPRPPSTAPPQA
ncbi:hypothetical protein KOAAANKH_01954 [Brevundimonas sp. NIBR10]|uniref:DUF2946 family protein n=1 Tax=Brevundimonas sp. NIBR10 TaxID=3015997 RepID=UPI0022F1C887|nr:DUF2946 family protein [Brevundimonas sp. NIBR10]WGM47080.1 hypothetical protein KOAAANKH_01954 [Brevundimonas sp. NIBR10]